MRFCTLYTLFYINLFIFMNPRIFIFFQEFISHYELFWNVTVKPYLKILFYSFILLTDATLLTISFSFWMSLNTHHLHYKNVHNQENQLYPEIFHYPQLYSYFFLSWFFLCSKLIDDQITRYFIVLLCRNMNTDRRAATIYLSLN